MLPGEVQSAPPNSKGFDADSVIISSEVAQAFYNSGFRFCLRYISHKPQPGPRDLSPAEAENILLGGLALMPVQHVRSAGWSPSEALGTTDGNYAVQHANAVGFRPGVNVWCDLEGVGNATAQNVIDYCNAWYDAVSGGGFVPGLYVGADAILSGQELYADLKFQHYWKSLSKVPAIPVRGYQMIQTPVNHTVHGISIDADRTQTDNRGGQVQWLVI
jgi:hypothetical protein